MKKFAPLLLLLAMGAFTVGCEKKPGDTPAAEPAATEDTHVEHTEEAPAE